MALLRIWARNMAELRMSGHREMDIGRETDICAEKCAVRRKMRLLRQELNPAEKQVMDEMICNRVLEMIEDIHHQSVYCYVPYGTEIDTLNMIQNLWKQGVSVAVPRVDDGNENQMDFYWITCMEDLIPGFKGILEPATHCRKAADRHAPVITPGLAFGQDGARIGYGGGYYDRFFSYEPEHLRIAVAYPFQILDELPIEDTDLRIQKIVTNDRIYTTMEQEDKVMELTEIGARAKRAASHLNNLGVSAKNEGLRRAAQALLDGEPDILAANQEDVVRAAANGMSPALIDRLELTPARLQSMADGLLEVAALDDPVGEVLSMKQRPNGLMIGQKRVPLGVVGMIYEARPNVTADAFGLCFKTGNAVILKGGSDAIESNKEIVRWIRKGLADAGLEEDAVQLIEDTDREATRQFMRLNQYVDVLIPRGGAGLIRAVVENSTVPVIETGTGNCHIYVDESADFDMALDIIMNAKTQRIGVCNACESLVVHRSIAEEFLPALWKRLQEKQVEVRAEASAKNMVPEFKEATEEDWGTEYLDCILSLKLVDSIDEAIAHINCYNTGHSEAIITKDYANSQKFLNEIDAAAVYVNASTRFTDGNEFGFGAEIGISTQKLHARGPMGLTALTTTKYIVYGNGQVRQ